MDTLNHFARSFDSRYTNWQKNCRYHGWRMGVLSCSCIVGFVLCCNIALLIAGFYSKAGFNKDGVADLIAGEEDVITRWNTMLHLLINILSTILLAGSNYTMQVLSSPTREEIDNAHKRGDCLEIGLLSFRNLRRISGKRVLLGTVLALSSIPLHLFYNASMFKITTFHDHRVIAIDTTSDNFTQIRDRIDMYTKLNNDQWKQVYGRHDVSQYGDLYLIVDQVTFDGTDHSVGNISSFFPFEFSTLYDVGNIALSAERGWMTYGGGAAPDGTWLLPNGSGIYNQERFTIYGNPLPSSMHMAYGLATNVNPQSRVQISLYFMAAVLAFNFLTLIVMVFVLVSDRADYIVTLGDASASFLEVPDPNTDGKCLLWAGDLQPKRSEPQGITPASHDNARHAIGPATSIWQPQQLKLSTSVGLDKNLANFFSTAGFLIFILVCCTQTGKVSWRWGTASESILKISKNSSLSAKNTLFQAWLANAPQIMLSFCYLSINAVCTCMASAQEWDSFGMHRKGLRVTNPRGEQRSTYFLQLPYRWSIPLIILSGFSHWLLSQTIFLVQVDYLNRDGLLVSDKSKAAVGISFPSLIVLVVVWLAVVFAVGWAGRQPLRFRMPPAQSSSLVISAACHPPATDIDPHLRLVKWGVIEQPVVHGHGHCSFSSSRVKKPEIGQMYV
ncbi:hypothetical protein BKA66DRAFT_440890 [Pyrenochaeta sp. MPI-SDFR-AT-0127]|nr:hypothetical protein BKA66DRAFT_440890 [Pyrenochaeta sp. MPI-SDFR-AT-0127]